jgi:hypothetical protein
MNSKNTNKDLDPKYWVEILVWLFLFLFILGAIKVFLFGFSNS